MISDVFATQETLMDFIRNPRAWVLLANPVWGRTETRNMIALFDSKEAAQAYVDGSKLPEGIPDEDRKTPDGIFRSFRPDSLLWDYNPEFSGESDIRPMLPWIGYDGLMSNPAAPSGSIPMVDGAKLDRPKYGRDYDVGYGGPRSDVDDVRPEVGHVESPKLGHDRSDDR